MPKVSVIVPVYNTESAVERCVDSILRQDYRDFELILMDDGSTDRSPEILDRYAASDGRVRVVHKKNTGVSDTRNQAISIASGTYIQFVDADDWIVPEAVGSFVRAADESGAGMVISDFYRVVGNHSSPKGSIDEDGLITRLRFAELMAHSPADYYYGVLWNKLFRKDLIEQYKIRMDEKLHWCEDFIFNMEYILHIDDVYVLRVPLYYYVKTEGSLIARGMNVPDIVRMKLNVIEYYSDFYKNIYNAEDYAVKRPVIYGFLFDFAHDDAAIPGLPGTKKLGMERTTASQNAVCWDLWTENYYESRLMERKFQFAALQTDLDPKEVRILAYLQHFRSIESLKEMADYVGVSQIMLVTMLESLSLKKMIVMEHRRPTTAKLGEQASKVLRLLEDGVESMTEASHEGMNENDIERYNVLRRQAAESYQRRLEN